MYAEAYYNLHKHCLSVREVGGRVIDHWDQVYIVDAKFVVSLAGNKRVRKEGRKNVHAVVRGDTILAPKQFNGRGYTRITYDPYKYRSFVRAKDGEPVSGADEVYIKGKKILAKGVQYTKPRTKRKTKC